MLKTAAKGPLGQWPYHGYKGIFRTDTGEEFVWQNQEQFANFVRSEAKFWKRVDDLASRYLPSGLPLEFHEGWKRGFNILDLMNNGPSHVGLVELDRLLHDYETHAIPTRRSEIAQILMNAAQSENVEHLQEMLAIVDRSIDIEVTYPELLPAADTVFTRENSHAQAKELIGDIAAIREQANKSFRNIQTQMEVASKEIKQLKEDVAAAIADAKKTVLEDRSLSNAQVYWNSRFYWHLGISVLSLIAFAAGICWFIAYGIDDLLDLLKMPVTQELAVTNGEMQDMAERGVDREISWMISFLRVGVPALLVVWLLRTALSIFREQARYAVDAKERATMVQAYHALHVMTETSKDDRHLMLKSLFRPSGAPLEDEPLPSYIDALLSRFTSTPKHPT
ncbi:hypothetical protein ACSHT0_02085 [Tepidicaulis sp. LMO-SS28]|uniref:hypothetical protein n=1 Tax=Tepidicaulis sp. LMO-SS28 TaxID=3447455 RepID=UPI003EE29719